MNLWIKKIIKHFLKIILLIVKYLMKIINKNTYFMEYNSSIIKLNYK